VLVKRIVQGNSLPPFYGPAWIDWTSDCMYAAPIPLNWLIAWGRAFCGFVRFGSKAVASNARAAYWQGYQEGKKSIAPK
jgi:hypothetical protein